MAKRQKLSKNKFRSIGANQLQPNVRSRPSRSGFVVKAAPYAAKYAAATGHPWTAAAIRAGAALYGRYRSVTSRPGAPPGRRGGISTGRYHGRFRRARRKTGSEWTRFARTGYVDTYECNGTVSDPNCVYIGHVAQSTGQTIYSITKSLLRSLLYKTIKYDAVNAREEIPGLAFDDTSNIYKINLLGINNTTGVVEILHSFETVNNTTMINLADEFNGYLVRKSAGYDSNDDRNMVALYKFELYLRDGNVTAFWNFQGDINLMEAMVNIKTESSMKIQNRSLSAGGSSSTDVVNNNPIHGYRYFMSGLPKTRDKSMNTLAQIDGFKGAITSRAAELSAITPQDGIEPPLPKHFVNCQKAAKVHLNPGDMKKGTIYYQRNVMLNTFLRQLNYLSNDAGTFLNSNLGSAELYALEDQINVNASELITIAYEINRKTGVYITFKKHRFSTGDFRSGEQNDNAE